MFKLKYGWFLASFLLFVNPGTSVGQSYDVIIRNGRILDGTGNPWFKGDVGIDGKMISAIGDLGEGWPGG